MNREKVVLLCWVAISIYVAIESLRMGLGNVRDPGPGFFPFWTAVVIGLIAVYLFLQEMRKKQVKELEPFFKGKNIKNIITGNILLLAYGLLFEQIGFILCTFLFTGAFLRVVGKKKWPYTIGVSLIVAFIAYMFFEVLLLSQFPVGKWVKPFISWLGARPWR